MNLVNYDYCEEAKKKNKDFVKVYKDFELWTEETYKCFLDIGFKINIKPKKVECFFEQKHIFIFTKNFSDEYLNIYQLNDNFNYEEKMVIKCKSMDFILDKIKNKYFLQYVYSLNSFDESLTFLKSSSKSFFFL